MRRYQRDQRVAASGGGGGVKADGAHYGIATTLFSGEERRNGISNIKNIEGRKRHTEGRNVYYVTTCSCVLFSVILYSL